MHFRLRIISLAIALAVVAVSPELPNPVARAAEPPAQVEMIPPEGDAANFWTRWRGPTGQGIVADGDYPDAWSATENVIWKVPAVGAGNSSPIVYKDRIFVTAAYDKGTRRSIQCLSRADGMRLWEAFAPQATPEGCQPKNGHASGTPTTDGRHVWAYFGNHGLLCVDLEGKIVWHQPMPEMDAYHGTSCSPLLYKDKVIVFQDHRSKVGSFVIAFDKATGKQAWKTARKEKVGWGSPAAIRVNGKDLIIVSSEFTVYAYDPETGKDVWTCKGNLVEVTPTPVVGHGLLFCCSGRAGPTLAIRPDGAGDVSKTHLAWRADKGSPFIPSPLLLGDHLYMVNDIVSVATCYEAKTGKLVWQGRMGEAVKHGFSSSPISVNGKLFFTNDSGETHVLAAGAEFKVLHVNKFNEKTLASPALLDGRWYWRTDKHLYCIGKKG